MAESEVTARRFLEGTGKIAINLSKIVTRCFDAEI